MAADISAQIIAALIGAGAGVATLGLNLWWQESGRRDTAKDTRRKESAQIVGRAVALTHEAANLLTNDGRRVHERLALAQQCRYERFPEVQKDLTILRGWHPSEEVNKMCPELEGLLQEHLKQVETRLHQMQGSETDHFPATAALALAKSVQLLFAIRTYDLGRAERRQDNKVVAMLAKLNNPHP
jgi:hypothetical protein